MSGLSHLLIRADANSNIGAGHVMRCLALAQAWKERGGEVTFAMTEGAGALTDRLHAEGMVVQAVTGQVGGAEDARQTAALAGTADRLVLDGYGFGTEYQRTVADAGVPFLVIDDYGHADHYYSDLVLNQNISAKADLYPSTEPHTRLLLGTRYAMLREEFRNAKFDSPLLPPRRLLLTLGGGDPNNVTSKVVEALQLLWHEDLNVTILAGGNNVHYEELAESLSKIPFASSLLRSTDDMPCLIGQADFVVSAGGSTCWELAFMGRPNLIVSIADNQSESAEGLDDAGVSVHAGWHEQVTPASLSKRLAELLADEERLYSMSCRGYALVDGYGAERVAKALLTT